ncbi:hypothetical protein [Dyadobacter luticola]|uniref:Outer membrane protein beta-barrel domain-containing protein n=1 Tax=Dyadobacter luticola TaxID=1979387 RepID=A0A5R9KRY3_9BACT|nr:hypothetical protein [Dyadobacter luticola]TLU98878.1 hypothetical protein FEN17_20010 [Dyadobacter luticola]
MRKISALLILLLFLNQLTGKVNAQTAKNDKSLIVLIQGDYSLLLQQKEKTYYIKRNDSLKVLTRDHFVRALPLIFGSEFMQRYAQKSKSTPVYNYKYLAKLVTEANSELGSVQVVVEQNSAKAKTTFYIGPYIAFSNIQTALEVSVYAQNSDFRFLKTGYFDKNVINYGIRGSAVLFPKISIGLNIFWNKVSHDDFLVDNIGFYKIEGKSSILIPEKFDPKVKLNAYGFSSTHFDFSLNYTFNPDSKFRAYVFAGPGLMIMTKNTATTSARFIETSPPSESFIYRTSDSKLKDYLVSVNGGLGIGYQINDRIVVNLSGKYGQGIFTKILRRPVNQKEQNLTPVEGTVFGRFDNSFDYRYDQFFRQLSAETSLLFKL